MKFQTGFTLIEMMIVVVILGIIAALISGIAGTASSNISYGINGMTESRCLEGYKFIIGQNSQPRQILDELGKGVRCEAISKPGAM
jgi:prepilin-type N-terminal cleavage/methylation domain-containing protein